MRIQKYSRAIFFISAFLFLTCAHQGFAASKDGPPETAQEAGTREGFCQLLKAHQYTDLDKQTNDVQLQYENGQITDINLLHIFRVFCEAGISESDYIGWISAYPKSYAAHIAYGVFLRDTAYQTRGQQFIKDTHPGSAQLMDYYARRGTEIVNASLTLTGRPLLSYQILIGLNILYGDPKLSKEYMEAADKIDPKNFIVKMKYMGNALPTAWGGSLDQMVAFREKAKKAGLPEEQLQYFDQRIAIEHEWLEKYGH